MIIFYKIIKNNFYLVFNLYYYKIFYFILAKKKRYNIKILNLIKYVFLIIYLKIQLNKLYIIIIFKKLIKIILNKLIQSLSFLARLFPCDFI